MLLVLIVKNARQAHSIWMLRINLAVWTASAWVFHVSVPAQIGIDSR